MSEGVAGYMQVSLFKRCVSLQEALWRMEDSRLSVEQLTALSRAVPEEQERRDLGLFLRV